MATTVVDKIQLGRELNVFVKEETTAGTLIKPIATDLVIPSGSPDFNQVPTYTDSTEVRDSRSKTTRFQDMTPAGTWSLPMYCRPSGTPGTAPDANALLKAGMGSVTTATSSVVYSPSSDDIVTLSLFVGFKDMVFQMVGCTVNQIQASLSNAGAVGMNFSGQFMQLRWAGKTDNYTFATNDITLDSAAEAKKFCANTYIMIYDDSGSDWFQSRKGYLIESINYATGVLTMESALATDAYVPEAADYIVGFTPSGTEVGTGLAARLGACSLGGTDVPLVSMDVTLDNGIKYLEDEISANAYPTGYVADARSVSASTNIYLRTEDLNYFRDSGVLGNTALQVALNMTAGDTAGDKLKIEIPQAEGSVPSLSGELEKSMAITFTGLATTSWNDEIKITYL
jgi:hypothetical protein